MRAPAARAAEPVPIARQVPAVLMDHNRHTAILVAEGPKWAVVVRCGPVLGATREPASTVRSEWRQYDYPVVKAAQQYLTSSYRVSEKAFNFLKEIIMGKQYTQEELSSMTEKELLEIMKQVTGAAPSRLKPKSKGVEAILAAQAKAEAVVDAKKPAPDEPEKAQRKAGAKKAGSVGSAGEGYKGHRAGSRKERAHKLFDDLGKDAAKAIPKIVAMGIAESTAKAWCSVWKR